MSQHDAIVEEVMGLMKKAPDGRGFAFERPPTFLQDRLQALPDLEAQRAAVKKLASFAHFLATKQSSEQASAIIMEQLDQAVVELMKANGARASSDGFER